MVLCKNSPDLCSIKHLQNANVTVVVVTQIKAAPSPSKYQLSGVYIIIFFKNGLYLSQFYSKNVNVSQAEP